MLANLKLSALDEAQDSICLDEGEAEPSPRGPPAQLSRAISSMERISTGWESPRKSVEGPLDAQAARVAVLEQIRRHGWRLKAAASVRPSEGAAHGPAVGRVLGDQEAIFKREQQAEERRRSEERTAIMEEVKRRPR